MVVVIWLCPSFMCFPNSEGCTGHCFRDAKAQVLSASNSSSQRLELLAVLLPAMQVSMLPTLITWALLPEHLPGAGSTNVTDYLSPVVLSSLSAGRKSKRQEPEVLTSAGHTGSQHMCNVAPRDQTELSYVEGFLHSFTPYGTTHVCAT